MSALLWVDVAHATSFAYQSTSCTTGAFSFGSVAVSCNGGDTACQGGDTLSASGTVTVSKALPSSYITYIKVCKFRSFNYNWMCFYQKQFSDLNVCDYVSAESDR